MGSVTGVPVPPHIAKDLDNAAGRVAAAIRTRDDLIVDAVEAGGSLREVAALARVSHQTVKNIVKRNAP